MKNFTVVIALLLTCPLVAQADNNPIQDVAKRFATDIGVSTLQSARIECPRNKDCRLTATIPGREIKPSVDAKVVNGRGQGLEILKGRITLGWKEIKL